MKDLAQNNQLLTQIVGLIETTKQKVALSINSELVLLNWNIGNSIKNDILQNKRADYGKEVIKNLSEQLILKYGRGFGRANLLHYLKFAEIYPEIEIVYAVSRQLTWTHIRSLHCVDNSVGRIFEC